MKKDKILVYGAGGYMGKLFVQQAGAAGLPVVSATRKNFVGEQPLRIFSVDDSAAIMEHISDAKLLINLAGPFKNTATKLIAACIENGTHYIDIAGEVAEMQTAFSFDKAAADAGVMLMPGAGFGVVPTDVVANLAKEKLPDATHLKIAYVTNGAASRGTLKTVLADINKAGVVLKNGVYENAMPAFQTFSFEAAGKKHKVVYNPWRADLFTARLSTGIQNIETYANFPGFVVSMMKGKLLWLRDLLLNRLITLLPVGPSNKQLQKGSTVCYAEVKNSSGKTATAALQGPEAYSFTSASLLAIAKRVMQEKVKPGFQTPWLYGADLLKDIEGVNMLS